MKAMFKVTVRTSSSALFSTENVIASSAADAIKKVEKQVVAPLKGDRMYVSDVVLVGQVTVE